MDALTLIFQLSSVLCLLWGFSLVFHPRMDDRPFRERAAGLALSAPALWVLPADFGNLEVLAFCAVGLSMVAGSFVVTRRMTEAEAQG